MAQKKRWACEKREKVENSVVTAAVVAAAVDLAGILGVVDYTSN